MVDRNRSTITTPSELQSPRFDEHAHLKAQPVTPIPKSRTTMFVESLAQVFSGGARSLALIVVLGIATGALLGMSLVSDSGARPPAADQASVLPQIEQPLLMEDAAAGVYGIQAARNRRSIIRRSRAQSDGQPRAYRFAVIR